jgi:IclR family transcriptional regulator, mhp operon transcriptional activator
MTQPTPYRDVRALERGLALIDSLAERGWMGPSELAHHTGIDRATIYRLLSTLLRTGFVVRRDQDRKYFLSSKIRALSFSVQERDARSLLVAEPLRELVEEIKWPSDFAVLEGGQLVIIGSNHPLTTMTFYRSIVGQTRPILRSALGRAILAAMSESEREEALETIALAGTSDAVDITDRAAVNKLVDHTRQRGYALSIGEVNDQVSAIALPVFAKKRVAGAINIVFFRSTFHISWVGRYLEPLQRCVRKVEDSFNAIE